MIRKQDENAAFAYIVDDDAAVRDSIALLLRSVSVQTRIFQSAQSFLDEYRPEQPGCLVLDVRMPRLSGIEAQEELNRRGWTLPIIFITGHGDVSMAVDAMRAGAFHFLQKPFKDDDLIRGVQKAIDHDQKQRQQFRGMEQIRQHYEALTPREREIADRLVAGDANKAVAIDLGLSERTVELHRAHIMEKMNARGLAQLVQMLILLGRGTR